MLILAPQHAELDALRAGFTQHGQECQPADVGRMQVWQVPPLQLTMSVAGHGKTQFALQTQYFLDHMADAQGVVCVGGAGALDSRLSVGDIIVGTTTLEHDYRIRFFESPMPQYAGYNPYLIALREVVEKDCVDYTVWFDRIASGDEDIVDKSRATELRNQTGAVCVAWEGSGAARAAAFNEVPFIEIRGIADVADESACHDYHQNLRVVMPRIAALLMTWRRKMLEVV